MNFIVIILIAISLSMDAFSLALSYGTMGLSTKSCFLLSLCVGIFHFFMPLIGYFLGAIFIEKFSINIHFLSGIIFAYIAVQMFKEYREEVHEKINMNFLGMLVFALGVSLDSFGVGFTMSGNIYKILKSVSIFAIFSSTLTFLGLTLGKALNKLFGDYAILFGTFIMIVLAVLNFVNFCAFN